MSVFNLVTAGLRAMTAMTQSGGGSLSILELVVSSVLLCSILLSTLRPDRNPAHRNTSAWPPPEGMYWGM